MEITRILVEQERVCSARRFVSLGVCILKVHARSGQTCDDKDMNSGLPTTNNQPDARPSQMGGEAEGSVRPPSEKSPPEAVGVLAYGLTLSTVLFPPVLPLFCVVTRKIHKLVRCSPCTCLYSTKIAICATPGKMPKVKEGP